MAFTEKYVSSVAGGSGNGLAAGTPFTWQQMITEILSVTGTGGRGFRYNIKADGTYNRGSTADDLSASSGTNASPIYMRGYLTTIGDGYLGRSSAGALITTNMPTVDYNAGGAFFKPPVYSVTESIIVKNSSTTGGGNWVLFDNDHKSAVIACVITSARNGNDSKVMNLGGDYAVVFECDIFQTATSGLTMEANTFQNSGGRADSCRIICSCPTVKCGIKLDNQCAIFSSLIKGAGGGTGVYYDDSNRMINLRNCTITGWQDGIWYNTANTDNLNWIAGNMITDNSRYGVNINASWCGIIGPNRTRDNVSGDTSIPGENWALAGRIFPLVTTDTGGPETDYTNAAANDYSLIAASPAKDANRPKNSDLGCYGLPTTVTGGGSALFHPLKPFIIRGA